MGKRFYTAWAYGTLIVDAYLALASVATRAAPQVRHYLPPYNWVPVSVAGHFLMLLVATWTAILALGCLRADSEQRESPHATGVLWFVLVLAFIWLLFLFFFLPPLLKDLVWKLLLWRP
jgi:hypothetical protein